MGDPTSCPICQRSGATWCPHQPASRPSAPPPAAARQHGLSTRGVQPDAWTPAQTAQVLKAVFCVGLGAGVWWLIRHSDAMSGLQRTDPLSLDVTRAESRDFAPWEPEL